MSQIRPLGNNVLIKRAKRKTTQHGILLPDSAQEKPCEGEVIATGCGKTRENGEREPLSIQVGDNVLFPSYSGTKVEHGSNEEDEYLIMSEEDVLGTLC